jgi:hypothetical protein
MSGFGAQMGSVFMSMKQRNRMGGFIPEHEKVIIARKPIMPAPPARIFNPKHISSYLTAPEKRSIYMEQIQLQDAIRKLQEPLRPSLELEKAVKRLEFNKLAELDARIRDQLSKGLITPDQYMERTQAYRNEFDTAVRRADIADLQSRLASVGLPAPEAGLPQTPVIAPRDFAVSNVLNPEGDLTRPIRIMETPLISMPASLQGNRPASETQRPQILTPQTMEEIAREFDRRQMRIAEEAFTEAQLRDLSRTGGRSELATSRPDNIVWSSLGRAVGSGLEEGSYSQLLTDPEEAQILGLPLGAPITYRPVGIERVEQQTITGALPPIPETAEMGTSTRRPRGRPRGSVRIIPRI